MLNIFITGLGINAGKTFIAAGLAATMQSLGYSTCVYKPVQTGSLGYNGFLQSPDLAFIKNIDPYIKTHSSYLLKESLMPVIAAEYENTAIDKGIIKNDYDLITKECDCVITESPGGITTPLAHDFLVSDMIKLLDVPVVIVIKPDPETINQTILTVNYAISKGINIRGAVINAFPEHTDNADIKAIPRLIEEYSSVKILGIIKNFYDVKKINPSDLITNILNGIDIENVFDVKIAKLEV